MQLEVLNADGGDDVTLAPRVARAVREDDLVVALAAAQQTQVLQEKRAAWVNRARRCVIPKFRVPASLKC